MQYLCYSRASNSGPEYSNPSWFQLQDDIFLFSGTVSECATSSWAEFPLESVRPAHPVCRKSWFPMETPSINYTFLSAICQMWKWCEETAGSVIQRDTLLILSTKWKREVSLTGQWDDYTEKKNVFGNKVFFPHFISFYTPSQYTCTEYAIDAEKLQYLNQISIFYL